MQHRHSRRYRAPLAGSLLVLVVLWLIPVTPVAAEPPVRGEVARLLRQAYDYEYRNSNNNVFRRSNHNHPTKNVFRSSRYYQRRLAASYSGYPLRTIYHGPRGDRSVVYPRRQPYGPGEYYPGEYGDYGYGYGGGPCASPTTVVQQVHVTQPAPEPAPEPRKQLTRADIEMVPIRVARRPATQKAEIKTVTLPDGRVRTIIASVPIEADTDSPKEDEAPETALTADQPDQESADG